MEEFADELIRVEGSTLIAGTTSYRLSAITSARVAMARENANEKMLAGFALFVGFDLTACGVISRADSFRSAGFACLALGALAALWAGALSPKRYLLIAGVGGSEVVLAKYGDQAGAKEACAAIQEILNET